MQNYDITNPFINKDLNLTLDAIDNSTYLSSARRSVLKVLVQLTIGDVAMANCSKLAELAKVSRMSVYSVLIALEKENFIRKDKAKGSPIGRYFVNKTKLDEMVSHFEKQRELFDKINKNSR